jgi:hypothetical protein
VPPIDRRIAAAEPMRRCSRRRPERLPEHRRALGPDCLPVVVPARLAAGPAHLQAVAQVRLPAAVLAVALAHRPAVAQAVAQAVVPAECLAVVREPLPAASHSVACVCSSTSRPPPERR